MRGSKRKRASFSDDKEESQASDDELGFNDSMSDEEINLLLTKLIEKGDKDALLRETEKIKQAQIKASKKSERERLMKWIFQFHDAEIKSADWGFNDSMSDEEINLLLTKLIEKGDKDALLRETEKIKQAQIKASKMSERERLINWFGQFNNAEIKSADWGNNRGILGSKLRSLGYGSSASKHTDDIDKTLPSFDKKDQDRKGLMLAHPFYRSFLRHIYNVTSTPHSDTDDDGTNQSNVARESNAKEFFSKQYADIWRHTDYGLVSKSNKNANSTTSEPCATSLLAGTINQLVPVILSEDGLTLEPWFPRWMSEFALRTSKTGENDKEPRSDGILGAPDPANNHALRALVSMEAKLSSFTPAAEAQSRSNACDAFSRQPKGRRPWPLIVLRLVLGEHQGAAEAYALVPDSETTAKLVLLWKGSDNKAGAIYSCVVAALRASKEFIQMVQKNGGAPLFCTALNNVAFQDKDLGFDAMVYKSFIDTERRDVNLHLVKTFVDPQAKEYQLCKKKSYLEMKDCGPILINDRSCSVYRFIEIGNDLEKLHGSGKAHGDIRLSNLILGGVKGTIVDWDLAGEIGEKKYPPGLQAIADGARHPEVQKAIDGEGATPIGDLALIPDHDWESLKAVMRCFAPADQCHVPAWESLICKIYDGDTRSAARRDFMVKLVADVKTLEVATGSPTSPP